MTSKLFAVNLLTIIKIHRQTLFCFFFAISLQFFFTSKKCQIFYSNEQKYKRKYHK